MIILASTSLNVVIEDEDDKEVETIDLLSNAAKYTVPFSYSNGKPNYT